MPQVSACVVERLGKLEEEPVLGVYRMCNGLCMM